MFNRHGAGYSRCERGSAEVPSAGTKQDLSWTSAGAVGDGEDAAEGEDRTERLARIRLAKLLAIVGEEVRCLLGIQHSQHRPQPRALDPLKHRVRALQNV